MRHITRRPAIMAAGLLAALAVGQGAQAAAGDTATYHFNYTAIGATTSGPHDPFAATLTLEELLGGGVSFLLQPNWSLIGAGQIDHLQVVFSGSDPGAPVATVTSPPFDTPAYHFDAGPAANMDSGYKSSAGMIEVQWLPSNQPNHFHSTYPTAEWTFAGVVLTDFTSPSASANNKVSPIFGVLSIKGQGGEASNWVTQVPEPSAYALALAGLGVLAVLRRRRSGG